MAHRRRRLYEDQGARTSILAGATAPRPDTLTQTGQITSHKPLADGAGHTFFKRQPEARDRRPHRPVAQPNPALGQQPGLQGCQGHVRMGLDMGRKSGLLFRHQLARPVAASRAGADLPGPPPPDQRLVDVRHADPKDRRRRPRCHAAVHRRQNSRPQVLRIALTLPPSHRRPHILRSRQRITHSLGWVSLLPIPANPGML